MHKHVDEQPGFEDEVRVYIPENRYICKSRIFIWRRKTDI